MQKRVIATKSGKLLVVYDDLFTYDQRSKWFEFIVKSFFKVNGADDLTAYYTGGLQMYSQYNTQDLENMGFIDSQGFELINQEYKLKNRKIKQARINLSPASEKNRVHTDYQGLTLLYYCNLDWQLEWGGHTLFMDDSLSDAEYTCLYKPGRVVLFDGTIPHMILTPTGIAQMHRFSFALQLDRSEND